MVFIPAGRTMIFVPSSSGSSSSSKSADNNSVDDRMLRVQELFNQNAQGRLDPQCEKLAMIRYDTEYNNDIRKGADIGLQIGVVAGGIATGIAAAPAGPVVAVGLGTLGAGLGGLGGGIAGGLLGAAFSDASVGKAREEVKTELGANEALCRAELPRRSGPQMGP